MTYDKKVAFPIPGLPRNRMSTAGMGLPWWTDSSMDFYHFCICFAASMMMWWGRDGVKTDEGMEMRPTSLVKRKSAGEVLGGGCRIGELSARARRVLATLSGGMWRDGRRPTTAHLLIHS